MISQIDRFDASWASIEKREEQSLKQLKSIATVRNVGASTRIEGSKMSDEEVEVLLKEIENHKTEYYRILRSCQANRPNVEVTSWVGFFFEALLNIQE